MTGSEFYTYVLEIFKRTDKSTEMYEAITDTIMEMQLAVPLEDYKAEVSVTGINTVGAYRDEIYDSGNTPEGVNLVIGSVTMKDTGADYTYPPLIKITKERYNELYFSRINTSDRRTGVPKHFCIFDKRLYVGPPVDKTTYVFQLDITTYPATAIVSGTASVPFATDFRWILRAGVLAKVFAMVQLYDESGYWETKYKEGISYIAERDQNNVAGLSIMKYSGV